MNLYNYWLKVKTLYPLATGDCVAWFQPQYPQDWRSRFKDPDQILAWLEIRHVKDGNDRKYLPDFIARCQAPGGRMLNLIIEITGMSQEKQEKKWYVENRWLPAVNAVREKMGYDEWAFLEVAGDVRGMKNLVIEKILDGE